MLEVIGRLEAVIAGQQAVIDQLQRRITALEGGLKGKGRLGMPGNKPCARPGPTERKGSRKPRPHRFARQRMAPAHRVEHVLETCPDCGTGLAGGWTQRTREVIEVPVAPAEVTEHVFVARVCPVCERRRTPKADLGGVVRGQLGLFDLCPAGGRPVAHTDHPMVSGDSPPVAP